MENFPVINSERLYHLQLSNNNIKQINTIPIGCIKLNLSHNRICSVTKNLPNNYETVFLDISYNRLISANGFQNLHKLVYLNLSNNYLCDDQLIFFEKTSIKKLELSNNNLKGKGVELSNMISKMKNLEHLILSNNHFERLDINCYSNSLNKLDIDFNKITNIRFSSDLPKLLKLNLANNQLEEIHGTNFISNIEYLGLSDNFICSVEFIKPLARLNYVNLNNNLLGKQELVLSSINLTSKSGNHVLDKDNSLHEKLIFKDLEVLEISNNEITDFLPLSKLKRLKVLNIDYNQLSELKVYNEYSSLESLRLNNNKIENVEFIQYFTSLSKLNLSFNFIKNAKGLYHALRTLPYLNDINLVENEFNKGLYNVETLTDRKLSNIHEFLELNNSSIKSDILLRYRADVIMKVQNVQVLDYIPVSVEERANAKKFESKALLNNNMNSIQENKEKFAFENRSNTSNYITNQLNNNKNQLKNNKNCFKDMISSKISNNSSKNVLESKYFSKEKKYAEDIVNSVTSVNSNINILDKINNLEYQVQEMKEEIINYESKEFRSPLNNLNKYNQDEIRKNNFNKILENNVTTEVYLKPSKPARKNKSLGCLKINKNNSNLANISHISNVQSEKDNHDISKEFREHFSSYYIKDGKNKNKDVKYEKNYDNIVDQYPIVNLIEENKKQNDLLIENNQTSASQALMNQINPPIYDEKLRREKLRQNLLNIICDNELNKKESDIKSKNIIDELLVDNRNSENEIIIIKNNNSSEKYNSFIPNTKENINTNLNEYNNNQFTSRLADVKEKKFTNKLDDSIIQNNNNYKSNDNLGDYSCSNQIKTEGNQINITSKTKSNDFNTSVSYKT